MAVLNYYFQHDPACGQTIPLILMKMVLGKSRADREAVEKAIFQWLDKKSIVELNTREPADTPWQLIDVVVGFFKNFLIGYSLQIILGVLSALIGRRSIKEAIKSSHSSGVSFACFLGVLLVINRGLPIILRTLFINPRQNEPASILLSTITGFVTGLSMYLWQSTGLATFALANALCTIITDIANRNPPSALLKTIFQCTLYGLSTAISLYALLFENSAVPEAWKQGMLAKMAGGQDEKHYQTISEKLIKALGLPPDWRKV